MIDFDRLKAMVKPLEEGKAYYRPFVCSGDLSKADIFLVGINPATPIYPEDIDIDSYVDLLLDYNKFMDFYRKKRLDSSKSEISRTRLGMNSFISWLNHYTRSTILETDVIPYPTPSLKELKRESESIKEQGKDIFVNLIQELKPGLIILHGKRAVEYANETFIKYKMNLLRPINLNISIEQMESEPILTEINYGNKKGIIMACRHFMYYGNNGETFSMFKDHVLNALENNKLK